MVCPTGRDSNSISYIGRRLRAAQADLSSQRHFENVATVTVAQCHPAPLADGRRNSNSSVPGFG